MFRFFVSVNLPFVNRKFSLKYLHIKVFCNKAAREISVK
jgi:hypothetical protein